MDTETTTPETSDTTWIWILLTGLLATAGTEGFLRWRNKVYQQAIKKFQKANSDFAQNLQQPYEISEPIEQTGGFAPLITSGAIWQQNREQFKKELKRNRQLAQKLKQLINNS